MKTTLLTLLLATAAAAQEAPRFTVVAGHISQTLTGAGPATPTTVMVEHATGRSWVLVGFKDGPGWAPVRTYEFKNDPISPKNDILKYELPTSLDDRPDAPKFPPTP